VSLASTASAELAQAVDRGTEYRYLAFHLGGNTYAIPLAQVAEITPCQELNHMPHMPKGVEGLLNLRGTVLPVLNLQVRMGLPAPATRAASANILVLDMGAQSPLGVLVDAVDSVIMAPPEQHLPVSPLLEGLRGAWVKGFLAQGERLVLLLDVALLADLDASRAHEARNQQTEDLETRMDEDLRQLIALAPPKDGAEQQRIIPQMEAAISHTEREMAKVLDRIEGMLAGADRIFQGLGLLKQQVGLGRLKGQEAMVGELESVGQEIQDRLFEVIQQIQFQDIVRQKLERVLNHVRGMQSVIGQRFRDLGRPA